MNAKQFITGDVGIFSSEHAQRLLGVVHNETDSILGNLHTLAAKRTGDVQRLYLAGLNVIPSWSDDVIKSQVVRIEAEYPDFNKLHVYCYLLLKKNMNSTTTTAPSTSTFYAKFLKNLCSSPEVGKSTFMSDVDFVNRRSIVLHCLRMTYHDLYVLERDATIEAGHVESPLSAQWAPVHPTADDSAEVESVSVKSTVIPDIDPASAGGGSVCFFD